MSALSIVPLLLSGLMAANANAEAPDARSSSTALLDELRQATQVLAGSDQPVRSLLPFSRLTCGNEASKPDLLSCEPGADWPYPKLSRVAITALYPMNHGLEKRLNPDRRQMRSIDIVFGEGIEYARQDLIRLFHSGGWTVNTPFHSTRCTFFFHPSRDGAAAVQISVNGGLDDLCVGSAPLVIKELRVWLHPRSK